MEDMLQKQIQYNCRLALPEGLRDLMSDISREVLRAQPPDLYKFIVDYLEALLLARDALSIACQVCRDVCECTCEPELDAELKNLGLEGEDLDTVKNVVIEYFDKGEVKEGNLLMKLLQKTSINEEMIPAVQEAVRVAYLKNQLEHHSMIRAKGEKASEKGWRAAQNTFKFHEDARVEQEKTIEKAARTIQAYFRAYLIRRNLKPKSKYKDKSVKVKSSNQKASSRKGWKDESAPKPSTSKAVRNNFGRLSSTSLAGSLIHLPKYVPYSVHDMTFAEFEDHEMERKNIDYTLETHSKDVKLDEGKKIVFHDQHVLHEIETHSIEEEYVEEAIIEEEIVDSRDEEIIEQGEEIVAEEIQSNASEEIPEVEEEVIDEKIIVNGIILELVSAVFGQIEREIDTVKHNIEEENTSNSDVSFLDDLDEEENKMKLLDEEIREQEDLVEEIYDAENYYNNDHLSKISITSSKKTINFFGE